MAVDVDYTDEPATAVDIDYAMEFEEQRRFASTDKLVWSKTNAYPTDKLMAVFKTKKEAIDWMASEKEHSERPDDYYDNMESWVNSGDDLEQIIVIENKSGKVVDIWDGWHRSAIAIANGVKSLPAIIGRPMTKIKADSFTEADIPRDFRVMLRLPNDHILDVGEQLAKGELKGITGITDAGSVLQLRMLGQNRNAMLVMPGAAVVAANSLSRVMYDNPEYLMSKDMSAAQRLLGARRDKESVIRTIIQKMEKASPEFMGRWNALDVFPAAAMAGIQLNSVRDFAESMYELSLSKVKEAIERNKPYSDEKWFEERFGPFTDVDQYVEATRLGLLTFGKDFVWEGEWIVKDKTLNIPHGSKLYILKTGPRSQEAKAIVDQHELDKKYKVFYVDEAKMNKASHGLGDKADKLVSERWKVKASGGVAIQVDNNYNNYVSHALREFRAADWLDEDGHYFDGMQQAICEQVIDMLNVFADEGHSGSSAMYAIQLFEQLAKFKAIAPLTGADDEWNEVGDGLHQNNRLSTVFKQQQPNGDFEVYDIEGIIWYDDEIRNDGTSYKSYFTNSDSAVPVVFPYTQKTIEKPAREQPSNRFSANFSQVSFAVLSSKWPTLAEVSNHGKKLSSLPMSAKLTIEAEIAASYQPHLVLTAAEEDKTYKALWVGGPPGRTMVKLKKKLEDVGIVIVRQSFNERKLPPVEGYDLVLFNVDLLSHNDYYAVKDATKEAEVPLVSASLSWSKMYTNLVASGFVKEAGKAVDQTWYHGSTKPITNFTSEFVGKGNDQMGPGIYFTSDRKESLNYGQSIAEVKLNWKKKLDPYADVDQKLLDFLLEKIPDWDAENDAFWGEPTADEAKRKLRETLVGGSNVWMLSQLQGSTMYYGGNPKALIDNVVAFGYSGFEVPSGSTQNEPSSLETKWAVVFDPSIIEKGSTVKAYPMADVVTPMTDTQLQPIAAESKKAIKSLVDPLRSEVKNFIAGVFSETTPSLDAHTDELTQAFQTTCDMLPRFVRLYRNELVGHKKTARKFLSWAFTRDLVEDFSGRDRELREVVVPREAIIAVFAIGHGNYIEALVSTKYTEQDRKPAVDRTADKVGKAVKQYAKDNSLASNIENNVAVAYALTAMRNLLPGVKIIGITNIDGDPELLHVGALLDGQVIDIDGAHQGESSWVDEWSAAHGVAGDTKQADIMEMSARDIEPDINMYRSKTDKMTADLEPIIRAVRSS